MIVERRTYKVEHGHWQDVVDTIKAEMETYGQGLVSRIFNSWAGPFDVLVHEIEFQDVAEREKFWAEWIGKRWTPEFQKKWHSLTRPGGGNEIWSLVE